MSNNDTLNQSEINTFFAWTPTPSQTAPSADPTVITATAAEVRAWAAKKGLVCGARGHLSVEVIGMFNRAHRRRQFTNRNPWLGGQS